MDRSGPVLCVIGLSDRIKIHQVTVVCEIGQNVFPEPGIEDPSAVFFVPCSDIRNLASAAYEQAGVPVPAKHKFLLAAACGTDAKLDVCFQQH